MTLPEIEATFQPELHALAEANKLSYEGTIEKITRRYDGYHFDFRSGIALYNPFSVLNVLSKQVFYDYGGDVTENELRYTGAGRDRGVRGIPFRRSGEHQ